MRKVSIIVCLSIASIGCSDRKDTGSGELWPRTVEPRLTTPSSWRECRTLPLRAGEVVQKTQCGPAAPQPDPRSCERVEDAREAMRMLALCTDTAIAILGQRSDPASRSDLAAAYYVRAQRDDRPSDLLRALDAADRAAAARPVLPAALFNRALIEEAIGLRDDAIASLTEFERLERSPWAAEARARRERLQRERALDARLQWPIARARIAAALRDGHRDRVARLIAPFASAAADHAETELLAQWARDPSPARTAALRMIAAELARLTGDPYTVDVVDALTASPDPAALREGVIAYADAHNAQEALERSRAAASFRRAARSLARAGNPLHLAARVRLAFYEDALPAAIEREAEARGYRRLLALVHSTRAHRLSVEGRFVESLRASEAAIALYDRAGHGEDAARAYTRRAEVFRFAGQSELAWRDAVLAIRHSPRMRRVRDRHAALRVAAVAALALDHPRAALRYSDDAVELLQRELQATRPDDLPQIQALLANMAIARQQRAEVELRLEDHAAAAADLDEAARLGRTVLDPGARRTLDARFHETRGKVLLRSQPTRAVDAFSRAIAAAAPEFLTYRASLHIQRADARRRAALPELAESDLRTALRLLETEEQNILRNRRRGEGEDLWSSYFSRFQESYRLLVQQLIETGRSDQAFHYAERARAYEPLDLLLQRPDLPQELRGAVQAKTPSLQRVRAALPPGTFILQYVVLERQTYVFIVSRDGLEVVSRAVGRNDVEQWSAALQRAARARAAIPFGRALYAPYDALIAEPLARIEKKTAGGELRLVFVPDGAMHGMPLAALRDRRTGRYLIERAPVSIAPSTALYLLAGMRDAELERREPSLLLVGDPAFDEQLPFARGWNRLPLARLEVADIAALYGDGAETLVAEQATVPAFLDHAQNKTVVHLAGHSIVNAREPWRSVLLLAPSAEHTGVLEAQELLTKLELDRTRLIVLSACSSAGGLPVGPEGVSPLVRPFITARVPAVIGTLWDVEDATARAILVSFHRHYKAGRDAAVALQLAQLDLLRKNVLAWAPFQVIGQASSPFAAPPADGGTHDGLHSSNLLQRPDGLRPR